MASFFFTGTSSTAQTLAAGENGFVGASGTLYTETATAVSIGSLGGSHGLNVQGTVATATGIAAVRTTNSTSATIDIVVGALGSITSTTTDAIRVTVTIEFDLHNAGLVAGDDTAIFVQGAFSGGQGAKLANSGTISGGSNAIVSSTDIEFVQLHNSGLVLSGSTALSVAGTLTLVNTGEILGRVESLFGRITNDGTITGNILATGSTNGGFPDLTLVNTGTITGDVTSFGGTELVNAGRISGLVRVGGDDFANVTNSGLIVLGIDLSVDDDTFTNAGGMVTGMINGLEGSDTFTIDRGDLRIDGGGGTDVVNSTASYRMGAGIEVLNLLGAVGLAGIGRDGDETINGSDGNDTLQGRAGNDRLDGAGGDDVLRGGAGNDSLLLTGDSDTLDGGTGTDTLILTDALRHVVNLATGTATGSAASGEADRSATLLRIENVAGSSLADSFTGSGAANLLQGNGGADTLDGGNGNDTLWGGDAADSLIGGAGADVLTGGTGADTMMGGLQADTFRFFLVSDSAVGAADRIADFSLPDDTIDLAAVDADPTAGGDQAFVFVGTAAFAGLGAQVRYAQDAGAGTTTVQVRLAGDAITDMHIVLTGLHALTAADFVL